MTHRLPMPSALRASGVVAVLRAERATAYLPVCRALAEGGVTAIEVTLTTPGALDALAELRAEIPHACIGVGTILDRDALVRAAEEGAEFLVTPIADAQLVSDAVQHGVPIMPGALTPTEAHALWRAGASAVKVFPASTVGPDYVRQLHGPFPGMLIMPSGGVEIAAIGEWLKAGAAAVSLGGPLLGDALSGGDLAALTERARHAVAAVRAHREQS